MTTTSDTHSEEAHPVPARRGVVAVLGRGIRRLFRLVTGILALGMAFQLLLVFTPLADRMQAWLDVTEKAKPADVIVCLGGNDHRMLWAANLYHRGMAPVVVVSNTRGAAEAMQRQVIEAGVPRAYVWVDNQSKVTADHPTGLAAVEGIKPQTQSFLIVTDREHSRRAAACFRRAGYPNFTVYAGQSTSNQAKGEPNTWRGRVRLLPILAYEYAALVKYWWKGHI